MSEQCNRCGWCCFVRYDNQLVRCKFLVIHDNGRTSCRVYANRVGTKICRIGRKNFFCVRRSDCHFNFPGCTLNREEWGPILDRTPTKEDEDAVEKAKAKA